MKNMKKFHKGAKDGKWFLNHTTKGKLENKKRNPRRNMSLIPKYFIDHHLGETKHIQCYSKKMKLT